MSKQNAWIIESEKTLLTSPVMTFVQQQCRSSEDGRKLSFYMIRSRDWCNVIPITEDGKIVMVRQHRIGTARQSLEFPGGIADSADADFQATALRELREETGYVPLPGAKTRSLSWTHPNPAILDNRCHSFVVGPVRREASQNLDSGEMIEVVEVPISDLPRLVRENEFTHALMLGALASLLIGSAEGSALLVHELQAFSRR